MVDDLILSVIAGGFLLLTILSCAKKVSKLLELLYLYCYLFQQPPKPRPTESPLTAIPLKPDEPKTNKTQFSPPVAPGGTQSTTGNTSTGPTTPDIGRGKLKPAPKKKVDTPQGTMGTTGEETITNKEQKTGSTQRNQKKPPVKFNKRMESRQASRGVSRGVSVQSHESEAPHMSDDQ